MKLVDLLGFSDYSLSKAAESENRISIADAISVAEWRDLVHNRESTLDLGT